MPRQRSKISSPLFRSKDIRVVPSATEKGESVAVSDGSSSSVNMRTLRTNLVLLKAYSDYSPHQLPRAEAEIYESIMHQLKIVHGTPPYETAMKLINEVFTNKQVKTGSVASSLIGCSVVMNDTQIGGCDPRCLNSLPKDNTSSNVCELQVFTYNGTLVHHGDNHTSSKAYVIAEKNFEFNESDRAVLIANGVEIVTVIVKEGVIYQKKPPIAVEQIPVSKTTSSSSVQWWVWLIVALAILIIALIILYICYRKGMISTTIVKHDESSAVYSTEW